MQPPMIETVVVQPTPFCNIKCSYCYLPQRNVTSVMAQETITTLFTKLFSPGWMQPGVTVIWHAGEPLVVPVSFHQTAFEAIERLRPVELAIRHSIQTNGLLIAPPGAIYSKNGMSALVSALMVQNICMTFIV
jgi:uncharacterized protein